MPPPGRHLMAMRVLWTHNFDPAMPNSQVYMNIAAGGLRALGVDLHLEFLGNLRSFGNLRQARRHVRDLAAGFDVVHAQYGSACALATGITATLAAGPQATLRRHVEPMDLGALSRKLLGLYESLLACGAAAAPSPS